MPLVTVAKDGLDLEGIMSELIAYFNGEFVPDSQCMIHATDRGFRTGDVVYDLQRTFDGKIFRLREHLERFMRSLKFTRLNPRLTIDELEALTREVVQRNEGMRDPGGGLYSHPVCHTRQGEKCRRPRTPNGVHPTSENRLRPVWQILSVRRARRYSAYPFLLHRIS